MGLLTGLALGSINNMSREMSRSRAAKNRQFAAARRAEFRRWQTSLIETAKAYDIVITRSAADHCVVKFKGQKSGTVMSWEEAYQFVNQHINPTAPATRENSDTPGFTGYAALILLIMIIVGLVSGFGPIFGIGIVGLIVLVVAKASTFTG